MEILYDKKSQNRMKISSLIKAMKSNKITLL